MGIQGCGMEAEGRKGCEEMEGGHSKEMAAQMVSQEEAAQLPACCSSHQSWLP